LSILASDEHIYCSALPNRNMSVSDIFRRCVRNCSVNWVTCEEVHGILYLYLINMIETR